MNDKKIAKELNAYLQGLYMGIHAYEHYIFHTTDLSLKKELQHYQQVHKNHAARIAERIQNLGAKAVTDTGFKLSMMEGFMRLKGYPTTTKEILQGIIEGQTKGIESTEKIVQGDLDAESLRLVKDNLLNDRKQVEHLQQLLKEHET